jgi:hypothetical protein
LLNRLIIAPPPGGNTVPAVVEKLKVLADLRNKRGIDLVYYPREDMFLIKVTSITSSIVPTHSLPDRAVTSVFAKALEDLFTMASYRVGGGVLPESEVDAAQRGLESLRDSYRFLPGKLQEFQALQRVIAKIPELRRGPELEKGRLDKDFGRFLITRMNQGEYFPAGHTGVCWGLCMDWICRKVHPARYKAWYSVSKKSSPDPMRARMTKKVATRIGALQEVSVADVKAGKLAERYRALTERYRSESGKDPARYYEKLWVEPIATGPRGYVVDLATPPQPDEGRSIFEEVLRKCQPREHGPTVNGLRGKVEFEAIIAQVDSQYAAYLGRCEDSMPFLVYLGRPAGASHAVALCKVRDGWHFYDPNLGEFNFPEGGREEFRDFLCRLWLYYRRAYRFSRFEIHHVYYSEEQVPWW